LRDANCFAASQTPGSFNLSKVEEQPESATSALIDPPGRPSCGTTMAFPARVSSCNDLR